MSNIENDGRREDNSDSRGVSEESFISDGDNIPLSLASHSEISTLTYPTCMQTTITSEELLEDNNQFDDFNSNNNSDNNDSCNESLSSTSSSLSLFSTNSKEKSTPDLSLSLHASAIDTSCFTNALTITSSTETEFNNSKTPVTDIDVDHATKHTDDEEIISSIISEMEQISTNNNIDDYDPFIFHNIGSSLLHSKTLMKDIDDNGDNNQDDNMPPFIKCALCKKILVGSHVLDCPMNHVMCYKCILEVINPDEIVDGDWIVLSTQQSSDKLCPACKENHQESSYTNIVPCPSLDKATYQTLQTSCSNASIVQKYIMRNNQYQNYVQKLEMQKQKELFMQKQYDIENRIIAQQRTQKRNVVFWKESIAFIVTVCVTVALNTMSGVNRKNDGDKSTVDDSKCSTSRNNVGKNRNRNFRNMKRK